MNEEEAIKSAAEALLLEVQSRFPDLVNSTLVDMLSSVQSVPVDSASDDHLLVTDSVYKAMGITSFSISQHVDFSRWFMTSLAPVLQVRVTTLYCREF
jgi:hypothetical protein